MGENRDGIARMRAVTISREYGSGGGEIAARLAKRLGWQLVDHEVLVQVAKELGCTEADVESYDEQVESLVSRILNSLQIVQPTMPLAVPTSESGGQVYQQALRRVVEAAAATGHVVIVGRGSQVILGRRRDILHARVVAPLNARIAYVMRRESLDRAAAHARIQFKDRNRVRYLQAVYHLHPEDAHLYDIMVNTAILGLDSAVDLLCMALEHKSRRLTTPGAELGPVAGLARYTGQPSDFSQPVQPTEPEAGKPESSK